MSERRAWTRDELLIAYYLYNQMPFGKISARNPLIIEIAGLLNRTPSSLSMKMANIASCDPVITSTGRTGLKGAAKADRDMWAEMSSDWETFFIVTSQAYQSLTREKLPSIDDDSQKYIGHERLSLIKARVGQQQFRQVVLSAYDYKCCITGLDIPKLLIASHIIPWNEKPSQRLNPSNGLCLSSIHDRAFDQGLITLNEHLELILSSRLIKTNQHFTRSCFEIYEGKTIKLPTKFIPAEEYLAYHRNEIFIG